MMNSKKKTETKINTINSDKVHKCSFKNNMGQTNTFIRSPFIHSQCSSGSHIKLTHRKPKLVERVSCCCVGSQNNGPVTWHTAGPQWESSDSEQRRVRLPASGGIQVFLPEENIFIQSLSDHESSKMTTNYSWNNSSISQVTKK